MKYSIIIPSFNHCSDLLIPCLNSIFKYTDLADIEIIISANGCVDDTRNYLDFLQEKFTSIGFSEHLKIVWSDSPTGYSKAIGDFGSIEIIERQIEETKIGLQRVS